MRILEQDKDRVKHDVATNIIGVSRQQGLCHRHTLLAADSDWLLHVEPNIQMN